MNTLLGNGGLAWRMLVRDWRAGELRLLLLAVALAVASLAAVRFFADRVELALTREANTLLAADLVLVSDHPVDSVFAAEARTRGLEVSATAAFLSMVLAGDGNALAGIKAVQPGYPLRGSLRVASEPYGVDGPTRSTPAPGEAWVDTRLAVALGVAVGDHVEVGEARLRVTAILTFEGERGGNFMALAPRLMLNEVDLPRTGLVQEGSRVVHRLLLAGDAAALAQYRVWAQARLARGERFEDVRAARPELRQVLDRAQRYLGLAALLNVLLAAAATQIALRRYVQRHLDAFALLRCFGASRCRLLGLYVAQLAALGMVAGGLGAALGWAAQWGMTLLLGDALRLALPAPGWGPALLGVVTGLALVLAFSLPTLVRLARVPALRVLRRDLGPPRTGALLAHGAGVAVVAGLLFWQAGDARLGGIVAAGVLVLLLGAALAIRLLLWPLTAWARRMSPGPRLGVLNLRRRGWETTLQAMALSLGLLALLLLTLVRGDLFESWRAQAPPGTPNLFLINIQPWQVEALDRHLRARGVDDFMLYPMVRGRLTHIGARAVDPAAFDDDRARRLTEREFNLSALAQPPAHNEIVAGAWWRPGETGVFSVEAGLAQTLGIALGDELRFDIGGLPFSGRVTSLRKLEWDSFRVNFFVIAPEDMLADLPRSYVTSFHLPASRRALLGELVAAFPNVTAIDVEQVVAELRALMDRVAAAVQVIFVFSLAVGVLVLLAALHTRRDERAREIGLWRAMGASRHVVAGALASEFAALGLLAGAVAAGAASLLAWVLAQRVFELAHTPNPWIWLAGLGGGLALVLGAGLLASRGLLRAPPLRSLNRE